MNTQRLITSLLLTLAAGAAVGAEIPQWGPIPFAAFDRDGNGLISESEFNQTRGERMASRATEGRPMRGVANAPTFKELDTNSDGNLSAEEHAACQGTRVQNPGGMGRGRP